MRGLPDDVLLCMRDKESEYGADGLQEDGERAEGACIAV